MKYCQRNNVELVKLFLLMSKKQPAYVQKATITVKKPILDSKLHSQSSPSGQALEE